MRLVPRILSAGSTLPFRSTASHSKYHLSSSRLMNDARNTRASNRSFMSSSNRAQSKSAGIPSAKNDVPLPLIKTFSNPVPLIASFNSPSSGTSSKLGTSKSF
eukprot:CAMPEP_0174894530 /NCGR_PEP_ID=MMETSP0167-20121228/9168_1 /TAXON_ID=38298 /ORGANISM="Rhodella maculata, Strain CCMP736" /LENGTH=102 /DNA_ID=CAMNT_0016133653 /DNA_START=122 /DNA_END=427 /DNA_ORIENTATION=-